MAVLLNPGAKELAALGGVMSGTRGAYEMPGYAGPLSLKTMRRGRGVWKVGGRSFVVEPGCALLLNQDQHYSFTIEGGQTLETFCPFFAPELVREAMRARALGQTALLDRPLDVDAPIPKFVERLRRPSAATEAAVSRLRASLRTSEGETSMIALLDHVLDEIESDHRRVEAVHAARPATRHQLFRQIHRAVAFAHGNVAANLSLPVMARFAGMSTYHFHRTFREVIGQTPARYVTSVRLDRARTLLESSKISVTEACAAVGFGSLGSFSSAFRRRFGVPPSSVKGTSQAGRSEPWSRLRSSGQ